MVQHRRAFPFLATVALLACTACTSSPPPVDSDWKADSRVLLERIDRLSTAGEIEAAGSVFTVFKERNQDSGLDARARMALAKGLLRAHRHNDALEQIKSIPWADKSPTVAADVVGLELAIRWGGLFNRDGLLCSGILPTTCVADAPEGNKGGAWAERQVHYRALAQLLDRGAKMVAAEGGQVALPARPELIQLARWAYGELDATQLQTALGPPERWQPAVALAVCQLHLAEHEIESAIAAAEVLWTRLPTSSEAKAAFRALRTWQLERRRIQGRLPLWSYPPIDQRLDALAATHGDDATAAQQGVAQDRELGQIAMGEETLRLLGGSSKTGTPVTTVREMPTVSLEGEVEAPVSIADPGTKVWRLATSYDGLAVQPARLEMAAGTPAQLTITSQHRGPHRIALYRLSDRMAWDQLRSVPERERLPERPLCERVVVIDGWQDLGQARDGSLAIPDLDEGFYAATATVRGSPVVALTGFTVCDPDLHLVAGRDQALAWVVRRRDGQAKAGEPVSATVVLERNLEAAAGAAWAAADPAWRSGFEEGFTKTRAEHLRITADQQAGYDRGKAAGVAAATADPPLSADLEGRSDAHGLVRFALPARMVGRSYHISARIARPAVAVERRTGIGADAAWTSKAVAWADKPLVRPGETLRFKALLRDFNGAAFNLPVGEVEARLSMGDAVLATRTLPISDHGTITGELLIPPGAGEGTLQLRLGDGPPLHLAHVDPVSLPEASVELLDLDSGRLPRAGETVPIRLRLRDRQGEPLAGVAVDCLVVGPGANEAPRPIATDLAGEVRFAIPTIAGKEADYRAECMFQHGGRPYAITHRWTTTTFPFPLEVQVRERELAVGGILLAECRLPADATVTCQLHCRHQPVGPRMAVTGNWPRWSNVSLPLDDTCRDADALVVSAPVLGGGTATRSLTVSIAPRQVADGAAAVALTPARARVQTGDTLALTLGVNATGRDLLVMGGCQDLLLTQVERLDEPARQINVAVDTRWAPNLFFEATAYLGDQGFVTSSRQEVKVAPIDRLLTVGVAPELSDYRPGDQVAALVTVQDWRGQGVGGCSLSVGVVDERVYQLQADETPDLWKYFHDYHRTWALAVGSGNTLARLDALLWRSVIRRWETVEVDGHSGSRCGGMRAMCRGGGSRGSCSVPPLILPATDSAIFWVADLRTGADGTATIRFPMPANAGRFRCTARANDASAAVLVGEVRTVLANRIPYSCSLDVAATAQPGDVIAGRLRLANHQDHDEPCVLTLPDGSTRDLTLAARSRSEVMVPVTVPASGPLVRRGLLLGQVAILHAGLRAKKPGAYAATAETGILALAPGHAQRHESLLVADDQGVIHLPTAIHAGDALSITARAWPDAASRRREALAEGLRTSATTVRAAQAWMYATPGTERLARLTELWSTLDAVPKADAAVIVLRQAAIARALTVAGIRSLPEGFPGDWLLARGRALGQALPEPRLRGAVARDQRERILAAATALAEGWQEGPRQWRSVCQELLPLLGTAQEPDATCIALACDAARLARDQALMSRFAARLAQLEWNDDLTAVLAVELLPVTGEAVRNELTIANGPATTTLPVTEFAEWTGLAADPLRLTSRPGALVRLVLVTRRPLPVMTAERMPQACWWQLGADGYERIADQAPLRPGRATLLVVSAPETGSDSRSLAIQLPSLLRLDRARNGIQLVEQREWHWGLDPANVSRITDALDARQPAQARDVLEEGLRSLAAVSICTGARLDARGSDSDDGASDQDDQTIPLSLPAGGRVALSLQVSDGGTCRWPGPQVWTSPLSRELFGGQRIGIPQQMPDTTLRIATTVDDDLPAPVAAPRGHPLSAAIMERVRTLDDGELRWLLDQHPATLAAWRTVLRQLDPTATQSLDDLLVHPHCGEAGHWTQRKLRRWLDAEPLWDADDDTIRERGGQDLDDTIQALARLVLASRADRERAWAALPAPQAEPRAVLATMPHWYEHLRQRKLVADRPLKEVLWSMPLGDEPGLFGYGRDLDGWVGFLRQELELPLRIVPGIHGAFLFCKDTAENPFQGDRLGSAAFSLHGLVLVETATGLEVRPLQSSPRPSNPTLSVDFKDLAIPEAITHLNLLLANRGLPVLRCAPGLEVEKLPHLTFTVRDLAPQAVLDHIVKACNASLARDVQGWEIRPR